MYYLWRSSPIRWLSAVALGSVAAWLIVDFLQRGRPPLLLLLTEATAALALAAIVALIVQLATRLESPWKLLAGELLSEFGATAAFRSIFPVDTGKHFGRFIEDAAKTSDTLRVLGTGAPAPLREGAATLPVLRRYLEHGRLKVEVVLLDPESELFKERHRLDGRLGYPLQKAQESLVEELKRIKRLNPDAVKLYYAKKHPMSRIWMSQTGAYWQPFHLGERKERGDHPDEQGVGGMHICLYGPRGSKLYDLAEAQWEYAKEGLQPVDLL